MASRNHGRRRANSPREPTQPIASHARAPFDRARAPSRGDSDNAFMRGDGDDSARAAARRVVARARATKCAPTPRSLRRRRRASSCASSCRTIICDGRGCDSRERVIPRRRCRWTCTGRDGREEMVEARMSWRGGRRNDRVGDDAIEARMERRRRRACEKARSCHGDRVRGRRRRRLTKWVMTTTSARS